MSIGAVDPVPPQSEPPGRKRPTTVGGSSRFVPGQTSRQVSVVNADIRLWPRLQAIWHSRELLVLLTRSELKVKYKNSVLGYVWSMLNPAMVLGIYYMVFSVIMNNHFPEFAVWLFSGLLVWNLFQSAAMGATTVVVGKAGIVKKVAFPRELLALSTVAVSVILFLIQVGVLIVALLAFQHSPSYEFLALTPFALLDLLVFTSAVSIFLSAINVYLRDTQHLTEVLLMAWFWGVPIVYGYGFVSDKLAKFHLTWLYLANPITPIALTFQRAIYGTTSYTYQGIVHKLLPTASIGYYALGLAALFVVCVVLFLLSLVVFGRLEGNFAEEL